MGGYTFLNLLMMYTYEKYGVKIAFAGSFLYAGSMSGILWAWICDGLIPIWINLSGLATIPFCGPNHTAALLSLALILLVFSFVAPFAAKRLQENNRATSDSKAPSNE